MPKDLPGEVRCSIARTMQILGDRWSTLIVREAFRGRNKFSDFRDILGIPSDILTARLSNLVEAGILQRRPYREAGARERFGYHLTPAGEDLLPVLGSLAQWGDAHRPSGYGPSRLYRRAETGEPVRVAFVTASGEVVEGDEVEIAPGPGNSDPAVVPYLPLAPIGPAEARPVRRVPAQE
ncbi:winged helix-turn-helix transcriptional regulator [Glaciibacter sp. 2TAF33]|uniref:winged helix-turn-helix transcriptional regulator n=1 Tax=Glaciibacter sp. 2TAF33 TaxID=3233015 RepID=UPI003F9094BF